MEDHNLDQSELFNSEELKEILNSLLGQESTTLCQAEIDKVAEAWAQVKRDKLFGE